MTILKQSKRRTRPLWELKRELKRRLRTMRPYQVNAIVNDLREFAIAQNFFKDKDAIDTILTFGVASAYDRGAVELAIRNQAQVKR